MNKTPKELTQMVALVALGASVGLTAQVNAAPPNAEVKKVSKTVDAKNLKAKKNIDARQVKPVDAKKLEVRKVNKVDPQMDRAGGPGRPPPP